MSGRIRSGQVQPPVVGAHQLPRRKFDLGLAEEFEAAFRQSAFEAALSTEGNRGTTGSGGLPRSLAPRRAREIGGTSAPGRGAGTHHPGPHQCTPWRNRRRLFGISRRVQQLAQTIGEQGYRHKLAAVLPGPVGHAWAHLTSRHFHRGLAQSLPLAEEPEWYGHYFPDDEHLRRLWDTANTSAGRNAAAVRTTHAIRLAYSTAHADLWQLAITEQRVRMLIDGIGAMLDPRPLERLRQAIHK